MPVPPETAANSPSLTSSETMRRWAVTAQVRPRVLLLARWPVGVVGAHLRNLYSALHAQGFTFTFVGPNDQSLLSLQDSFFDRGGLEFVGAPVENKRCRMWPLVRALLREGRFGVIHTLGLTAVVHASLANLGLGVPHLASLYDPLGSNQFPGWLGRLKHWTLTQALQKTDVITTTNQTARINLLDRLPALKSYADRIVSVPTGIASEQFESHAGYHYWDLRERCDIDRQVCLLGSLGYALSAKEYAVLLDSVDLLRWNHTSTPFHVVYLSAGDLRAAQQNILRRGLEKHLSVVDVSTAARSSVLRELDLLVLVSNSSATTLLAMEAMALGIPVLAPESLAMRETFQGTPIRWVRPGNAEALAEVLRQAITQPFREEARSFAISARERFDRRPWVLQTSALLESLAARRGQAAKAA